jgi:hypothetical protein
MDHGGIKDGHYRGIVRGTGVGTGNYWTLHNSWCGDEDVIKWVSSQRVEDHNYSTLRVIGSHKAKGSAGADPLAFVTN